MTVLVASSVGVVVKSGSLWHIAVSRSGMKSRRRKGAAKLVAVGERVSNVSFRWRMCRSRPVKKDSVRVIKVSRSANAW